MSLWDKKRLTT